MDSNTDKGNTMDWTLNSSTSHLKTVLAAELEAEETGSQHASISVDVILTELDRRAGFGNVNVYGRTSNIQTPIASGFAR